MINSRILTIVLRNTSIVLLIAVFVVFGCMSPEFRTTANLVNILVQSASPAIVAIGMTLVLLTAGIDLSVGAIMFITAALVGKMALSGQPLWLVLAIVPLIGLACGGINALLIVRLSMIPFIVTLATLHVARGLGLWITQTRAMNLPEYVLQIGSGKLLGIPLPIVIFFLVVAISHILLTQTMFGRQVYAVGNDPEVARKAGINVGMILVCVYLICGLCAAVGGLVSLAQLGSVSPTFGQNREFIAIAAAVLGGTSLFGGRGRIFPGTVIGAILIQTIENGLVIVNANEYLYSLITSCIIFLAVLVDGLRHRQLQKLKRRKIRIEE
ncbi:MAG: ABC transporter permease [Planctomycetota bacterium]|jgi:ribose transport system permease protein